MTQTNRLSTQPNRKVNLMKRMFIGGGIALCLISFFVFSVQHPNPEWGKFWMIKPLILTPVAGALGGGFSFFLEDLRAQRGWKSWTAVLISSIVFIVALWMGTVLGLNGTLWN